MCTHCDVHTTSDTFSPVTELEVPAVRGPTAERGAVPRFRCSSLNLQLARHGYETRLLLPSRASSQYIPRKNRYVSTCFAPQTSAWSNFCLDLPHPSPLPPSAPPFWGGRAPQRSPPQDLRVLPQSPPPAAPPPRAAGGQRGQPRPRQGRGGRGWCPQPPRRGRLPPVRAGGGMLRGGMRLPRAWVPGWAARLCRSTRCLQVHSETQLCRCFVLLRRGENPSHPLSRQSPCKGGKTPRANFKETLPAAVVFIKRSKEKPTNQPTNKKPF